MNDVLEGLVEDTETFLIPLTSILQKVGKLLKNTDRSWVHVCSSMCMWIFKCPLFQGRMQGAGYICCRNRCYWGSFPWAEGHPRRGVHPASPVEPVPGGAELGSRSFFPPRSSQLLHLFLFFHVVLAEQHRVLRRSCVSFGGDEQEDQLDVQGRSLERRCARRKKRI